MLFTQIFIITICCLLASYGVFVSGTLFKTKGPIYFLTLLIVGTCLCFILAKSNMATTVMLVGLGSVISVWTGWFVAHKKKNIA